MSIRIMADGKAYDRTQERQIRPAHQVEQCPATKWLCCANLTLKDGRTVVCRAYINRRAGKWVHSPGTFWENDTPRWR